MSASLSNISFFSLCACLCTCLPMPPSTYPVFVSILIFLHFLHFLCATVAYPQKKHYPDVPVQPCYSAPCVPHHYLDSMAETANFLARVASQSWKAEGLIPLSSERLSSPRPFLVVQADYTPTSKPMLSGPLHQTLCSSLITSMATIRCPDKGWKYSLVALHP